MDKALVVCIGNVARGDDGVAHAVARLLARSGLSDGARILAMRDLDVALAQDVAAATLFVLVDAVRRERPPVTIEPLVPRSAAQPTGHGIDAASLLFFAAALWGNAPAAVTVTVAGPCMDHGEGLSDVARAASIEAASVVIDLVRRAQTS